MEFCAVHNDDRTRVSWLDERSDGYERVLRIIEHCAEVAVCSSSDI